MVAYRTRRSLRLPASFTPTHQTAGLAGFPAIDVFGQAGTPVISPVTGRIVDVHMIPWNQTERVGGETAYLQGSNDRTYFLTHLAGNVPTGPVTAGEQIGVVGAVPGNWWQSHVHEGAYQGIYNPGGTSQPAPAAPAAPASASGWPSSALLAYQMARSQGANPAEAKDFATVQYGESGFDPSNYVGKSQGGKYTPYQTAAGLYQLLSKGYVDKANQLGGVFNPRANIQAILPDYLSYYRSHPQLVPGAAGAAVEKSGEGPGYYAQGYQHLPGMPAAAAAQAAAAPVAPAQGVPRPAGATAPPAVHTGANMAVFSSALLGALRSGQGITPAALLTAMRASTAHLRA
jgi:hypothetical protein